VGRELHELRKGVFLIKKIYILYNTDFKKIKNVKNKLKKSMYVEKRGNTKKRNIELNQIRLASY